MKGLLLHGVSPRKLALSVTCGLLLGMFPVLGTTIALCTLAAMGLRLNFAAMQTANHLVYPLQLAMLVPFIRAGQTLLHVERTHMTLRQMVDAARVHPVEGFHLLWKMAMAGIAAWGIFAAVTGPVLYWVLVRMMERVEREVKRRRGAVTEESVTNI